MKFFRIALVVLVLLINLVVAFPSWAERPPSLISNSDHFQVGQKVIWLYKPRADSADVQRVSAEVVKIGSKQVQIKVNINKQNNKFVNRWVNRKKLENLSR